MSDDLQQTPPRTTDTSTAEDELTPSQAEERKFAIDDVEAESGEDVKGGGISFASSGCP